MALCRGELDHELMHPNPALESLENPALSCKLGQLSHDRVATFAFSEKALPTILNGKSRRETTKKHERSALSASGVYPAECGALDSGQLTFLNVLWPRA